MRLFTFSGVSGSLSGLNAGLALVELARQVVDALPAASKPIYSGADNTDHFRSYVNYGVMLKELDDCIRLSGSTVLNEEAARLAPPYATAMLTAVAGDPKEDIAILAHSQGTNNLTHALLYAAQNYPQFFKERRVRCVLLDPKVGRNYMERLFGMFPERQLQFLFFQSQMDILGNQSMLLPKFITEFPHGTHIWVKGLDHSSIHEWAMLNKPQRWLDLFGFMRFRRAYGQEVIALRQETRGGQLGTMQLLKLDKWMDRYGREEMNQDRLSEALLGFLQGRLAAKFLSKES